MDWLTPVLVLLAAVLTQAVSVWRDRRSRAGQIQDERFRAYSELVTALRTWPMTLAKGYRQDEKVDLTEPLAEFHLGRTKVELIASPAVREALDDVGKGFDEFDEKVITRLNERIMGGQAADEVWLIERWDQIMLPPVNRLVEVMREDLGSG